MGTATDGNKDNTGNDVDELFDSLGLHDVETDKTVTPPAVQPDRSDSRKWLPWAAALGVGLLVGIGAVFLLGDSSPSDDVNAGGETVTTPSVESDLETEAADLRQTVAQLGFDDVQVEVRDSTIHLVGNVGSEQDKTALRSAVTASSNPSTVDMTAIEVKPAAAAPGAPPAQSGDPAAGGPPPPPGGPPPGAPPPGFVNPTPEQRANLQAELDRVLVETPLVFDSGSKDLNELQLNVLNTVIIKLLEAHPGVPVRIVGYTDSTGDEYQNQLLSLARATAVSDYLIASGVPDFIVRPEGRGENEEGGEIGNRRVEIEVIDGP